MMFTEVKKIQERIIVMRQKFRPMLGRIAIDMPFGCPSKNVSHIAVISET